MFPMMSDSTSVVSRISDSMELWYRNMGGLVFDARASQSTSTVTSWLKCEAPSRQDANYIRHLLMDNVVSPGASASVSGERGQGEEDLTNTHLEQFSLYVGPN